MGQEHMSAGLTVAVPAARVFAVLADPRPILRSMAPDGCGGRRPSAADRVGQIFRMDMYHPRHPTVNYRMANKVQVLESPRAIGWLPGREEGDGDLEFGGWTWRYDLAPLGPSETEVTLTYDWSAVPQYHPGVPSVPAVRPGPSRQLIAPPG